MAVSIHRGVVRRDTITDDLPRAEDLSNYKICEPGDIVLNRMRAFQGAIGISPQRGLVSPDYLVLRPGESADARYLHHLFRSSWFVGEMVSRLRGIGNTESGAVRTPRINPEDLGDISAPLPSLNEQRRIADFLDAETALMDAQTELRSRQRATLDELALSMIDDAFKSVQNSPQVRLGYLALVQTGVTVDGGREHDGNSVTMPYLRVANVQAGYVILDEISEISVPRQTASASRLRSGDVLMTEGGDLDKLGRGTVWHGEIENCLHQNHVFAVRPDNQILTPEYLALLTRTSMARKYFESTGNKTTNLASTSSGKIRDFRVPLTDVIKQCSIVREVDVRLQSISRVEEHLSQQTELLAERRRTLITAAVTGQLDVTTIRRHSSSGGIA
ncbi:restriction endonuclease subunit S [Streptomyces avidinii]